jgi:hypothetical protein
MSDGIKVGSRVIIAPEGAESFLQPWRKFAHEGRIGTVTHASRHSCHKGMWWVTFDAKRANAKPQRMDFRERDLRLAPPLA